MCAREQDAPGGVHRVPPGTGPDLGWERLEAVLDAALDAPPGRRAAVVAERCGSDGPLRARVERILAACDDAAGHFEVSPRVPVDVVAGLAAARADAGPGDRSAGPPDGGGTPGRLSPGDRVGAYRIEVLLGTGGMGTVWRARRVDGSGDRPVALKVIRPGMVTDEVLGRFRQEQAILDRLRHPGIAALVDGGVTPDGIPFLAMEVVHGEPIDAWCAMHRLHLGARLRLVVDVCDAVACAHRARIVHRDLKPANILVLADGRPKLLDFGIAKLLEDGGTREFTSAMGPRLTPDYAAPERLLDQPTTPATDIYSLGVLLYELLTGSRPHGAAGGTADLVRMILGGRVPPPSTVAPAPVAARLRGHLDALILKAMCPDPARRHASVEALAAELEVGLARLAEGTPREDGPDGGDGPVR